MIPRLEAAVAVAAHECGHAFQHAASEPLFLLRTRIAGVSIIAQRLGSLLLERFFVIPGLGYLMIEAIGSRDFQVINALTFIVSVLFVLGNLATDVCYALVDPRVSLH